MEKTFRNPTAAADFNISTGVPESYKEEGRILMFIWTKKFSLIEDVNSEFDPIGGLLIIGKACQNLSHMNYVIEL